MVAANVFLFTVPLHFDQQRWRKLVVWDTLLGHNMLGHVAKIP